MKLTICKSALISPTPSPPVVYSTDRSKAMVPVLVLISVALWFILRGNMFYVSPCLIFSCVFSVLIDLFNVIVFIRTTDCVITMLCHVTNNFGWQNTSGFIDTN